jgi:two-component system NtrC family sensor kinase
MKTLGEAAIDLPWLAPNVASMTTLARSQLPSVWTQLRTDPGFVLLSARVLESSSSLDVALLEAVLHHHPHFHRGFVDWNQPGPDAVQRACFRQAILASQLAQKVGCDSQQGWIAGFLAPLGWLAVTAAAPDLIANHLEILHQNTDTSAWQRQAWGHDHIALTRRLSRCWRLPAWLSSILGHLSLHTGIAERLGAEARMFQVVQLTVLLMQERQAGLGLPVGAEFVDLLNALHLDATAVGALADAALRENLPAQAWHAPAKHALLPDLLRLALQIRRQNDAAWIERLHQELDQLQDALVQQCADEKKRLQTLKLSALAELAAGAGHEINNPLAVISSQAQYVLKQMDWLHGPAEEIENVREYLDSLRVKIAPSLQKIIDQTQRVHAILIDLMQFARPSAPRLQAISVRSLIREVADSLQSLAQQRKVKLIASELDHDEHIQADLVQVRTAVSGLLRNAIEAAPADGWASVRTEKRTQGSIDLIVEDNGNGPCPTIREHLFDPFFSGRSAGRGRGMGLPIAWRLAQQQGGDVSFDGIHSGVTRFILSLPLSATAAYANANGYHIESDVRNGSQAPIEAIESVVRGP